MENVMMKTRRRRQTYFPHLSQQFVNYYKNNNNKNV